MLSFSAQRLFTSTILMQTSGVLSSSVIFISFSSRRNSAIDQCTGVWCVKRELSCLTCDWYPRVRTDPYQVFLGTEIVTATNTSILSSIIIIVLVIRQRGARASTLSTHIIPEKRRQPGKQTEIYALSPTLILPSYHCSLMPVPGYRGCIAPAGLAADSARRRGRRTWTMPRKVSVLVGSIMLRCREVTPSFMTVFRPSGRLPLSCTSLKC